MAGSLREARLSSSLALIRGLKARLHSAADPLKAPAMRAYMKSEMPYLGIPAPKLRALAKAVFAAHPLASAEQWRDTVLRIWRGARHREERYAGISLAGYQKYAAFRDLDAIPMYEEMITSGAWWDYVDSIASQHLGAMLRRYPRQMRSLLLRWSRDADMWKRRSAILAQLSFREETDLTLLYRCLEPSLRSSEFFLRKAIGWALRQYAWTDPDEVRRYVLEHESELSPLSRREALKNIAHHAD